MQRVCVFALSFCVAPTLVTESNLSSKNWTCLVATNGGILGSLAQPVTTSSTHDRKINISLRVNLTKGKQGSPVALVLFPVGCTWLVRQASSPVRSFRQKINRIFATDQSSRFDRLWAHHQSCSIAPVVVWPLPLPLPLVCLTTSQVSSAFISTGAF